MRKTKHAQRITRHHRIRAKVSGTAEVPRVAVYRSNRYMSAQIIDDDARKTLLSAHTAKDKQHSDKSKTTKTIRAAELGTALAQIAKEKGIKKIVFDRGGHAFHGRVKAFAEGLRKGGIQF